MDPEAMRQCMSFGFSDKKSKSAIGQCMDNGIHSTICSYYFLFIYRFICSFPDGNGFKTSTMRLGADVIVFSRHHTINRLNSKGTDLLVIGYLFNNPFISHTSLLVHMHTYVYTLNNMYKFSSFSSFFFLQIK